MENNYTPETINIKKKELQVDLNNFYKNIATGGPGLSAIVRLSDLKITFVNKQFEHHLGYTNLDLESEDIYFTDLLEHNQLHRFLYQLSNVTHNIEARSRFVIYRLKNKSSEIATYYLYAAPFGEEPAVNIQSSGLIYLTLHPNLSKWDMPFTSFVTLELFLEHFDTEDFGTFEWILDVDNVFWSTGVYRIYEVDDLHREIDSNYALSFLHLTDKTNVEGEIQKSIASGADLNIDYKIITAKQNLKIIHCLAKTIENEDGKPVKFAGSLRDVTNQRSIEEDLKAKVMELNQSNKELEEFAYVASHDMQEPLRKITTFSDRLSEKYKDVLTGDGALYLSRMIASAENMRLLINDLLEFSRISKTAQPFEMVNLNDVLIQVKTDLELTIEETGTIIKSRDLPSIEAIPSQMKQLFSNIITNAIKFHKPGISPLVTIESSMLSDFEKLQFPLIPHTTYYKLQFTDNGIGFEDEYATRIFQVFQRLHGKSEYPGSGIGLAICKKIVDYHHGIIYAESIPGIGACFVFIIPQFQQKPKGNQQ